MPSVELLLRAHPGVGVWWVLGLLVAAVAVARGRRPGGRSVATLALGTVAMMGLAPPRGGPVPGLARTCDVVPAHLLWPWQWLQQDTRLGIVALMVLAGACVATRPRWQLVAAGLPVVVETLQWLVPQLARACSVPDAAHAWLGLAVGTAAGLAARLLLRRVRRVSATVLSAVAGALLVLASWTPSAAVDPLAQAPLRGEGAHAPDWDEPGPADRAWLARGEVPGAGTHYEQMATVALWDVRLLTRAAGEPGGGLPHAGPAEKWGYFWPRDGAFLAVALARTGHESDALAVLARVDDLYLDPVYGFDARYLLDGRRVVLDPRRAQVDGCGWTLWAVHETRAAGGDPAGRLDSLRDRCTDQLLRATGGGAHLPAPGQDYWEQTSYVHLLGASAPVAAGLRLAALDYTVLGRPQRADVVSTAAADVRAEIARHFGPGFDRAGATGGLDAATAMLMPPFDPDPLPGVREAWLSYQQQALRPAGGLAPGTAWKQDGTSWTPEVALVAYTAAAAGEEDAARHWLAWLDAHRAPWGSLPEKVDARGRPGGPAPLGWTSALVVLTLEALEDQAP